MIIPVRGGESVEVAFETRTVGPLVLTTPVFRNTGFGQIIADLGPPGAGLPDRSGGKMARDAQLDGVYLLVAHKAGLGLDDKAIFLEWKEQHKIEHRFALLQSLPRTRSEGPFMLGPVFLKTPKRIASLVFLIMAAAMVACLIERQVRTGSGTKARAHPGPDARGARQPEAHAGADSQLQQK